MISVNQRAAEIVRQMMERQEELGLRVHTLGNGTTVIDAGIEATGSLEAGCLLACACLGGLGRVRLTQMEFSDAKGQFWLPAVTVAIEHPHIACMAAQYAGWAIRTDDYFAIGSGPARALYAGEEVFQKLDYRDAAKTAVLVLEGRQPPNEKVAEWVSTKCGVSPKQLFILIAPTASLVGCIQVSARSVETAMHKMLELGLDVRGVEAAHGVCPLAPVAQDDLRAIAKTNDAILYGSRVFCTIRNAKNLTAELVGRIPSCSSRDYGKPFYELLSRYEWDFYRIDRMLFSPAQVLVNDLVSGRAFSAGVLNPAMLRTSLLEG